MITHVPRRLTAAAVLVLSFAGLAGVPGAAAPPPDGSLWLTTSNHPRQPRADDDRILRLPAR